MAESLPDSLDTREAAELPALPEVQIEVRQVSMRPLLYSVSETGFLVGGVAGCDLRLSDGDAPPLVCLITRSPGTVHVRRLVPTLDIMLNGESLRETTLADGDTIRIGNFDLIVHITPQTVNEAASRSARIQKEEFAVEAARLQHDRAALEAERAQYNADIVRLDRQRGQVDEGQRHIEERARELDERSKQQELQVAELSRHARLVHQLQQRVETDRGLLDQQTQEVIANQAAVAQRTAMLESQQVNLAQLRTRVERMREDAERENQALAEQRARHEQDEQEIAARLRDMERQRQDVTDSKKLAEEESQRLAERRNSLDAAEERLKYEQGLLAKSQENQRQQTQQLESERNDLAKASATHEEETKQLVAAQEHLSEQRQKFAERETILAQAESARNVLQEQLRRRDEELAERQKALVENEKRLAADVSQFDSRYVEQEQGHEQTTARLAEEREAMNVEAAQFAEREAAFCRRKTELQCQFERLKHQGRVLGASRKLFYEEQHSLESKRKQADDACARQLSEFQCLRDDARVLAQELVQWEAKLRAADEHFETAREQLRSHLSELHDYARHAQEEVDSSRTEVEKAAEQHRHQMVSLRRNRDEDRLAAAAFRQQLIDWQGKVAELKRSMSQSETRLELREVEVNAISARLRQQSEEIQSQHREVTDQRDVMERHLEDMQEWYRRKLRDLSERFDYSARGGNPPDDSEPRILSLSSAADSGDRKLGDLLRTNQLVDPDTLTALLVEAKKQRRSLRQVLLASGAVTLYQLALIEAGNLDGLVLGPVRIVDRLRASPREVVYRVYDPRQTRMSTRAGDGFALLHHLSESEMRNAVRPDEFRQRFGSAIAVQHPHVAATYEVLEIHDRPAALQESVLGLAASEWPAVFAVPGVLFRVLNQAVLGLNAMHQAGLVHGHISAGSVLLAHDGILKICGLGEPRWLASTEATDSIDDETPQQDLTAIGRIAAGWLPVAGTGRKRLKSRSPADALHAVVQNLADESPDNCYADAAALLEELDRIGEKIPPNTEAWEQLLRHVRDHTGDNRTDRTALAG